MTPAGFPHSDTPGSTLGCQLPRAYRRLLRPSSALDAKASTMCPSQLVTNKSNKHTKTQHNNTHPDTSGPGKPDTAHITGGHRSTQLQRCSRPLSRSQTTTPTHPTHTNTRCKQQQAGTKQPATRPLPPRPGPPEGPAHVRDRETRWV